MDKKNIGVSRTKVRFTIQSNQDLTKSKRKVKLKILNLYAGIGGNRKLWDDDKVEVTAIEINPSIAKVYQEFFPMDKVIIADAHQFLLEHFEEYDFIWSSPPCPTHSRMRLLCAVQEGKKHKFPDMLLYEEILFLKHFCKCKWVVENVISYYKPLIRPQILGNHYYWSNFFISNKKEDKRMIIRLKDKETIEHKEKLFGIDMSNIKVPIRFKVKMLNNCVEPKAGLSIFNQAFNDKQSTLGDP